MDISRAWIGNTCHKFEAMFLEVDDIMQERMRSVENQLWAMRSSVKKYCSDIMQDVILEPSMITMRPAACDPSSVQNSDWGHEMPKEGINEDHFEKESCNMGHLLHSCPVEPIKVMQCDLSLEEAASAGMNGKSEVCVTENLAEEKQLQLEMTDKSTLEEISMSLSPKINLVDVLSSDSVNLTDSCESEALDAVLASGGASAESVGMLADSADNPTSLSSSYNATLDGSCILVDSSEISSVSIEAGKDKSYKKYFKEIFTTKKRAEKQDKDQLADWHGNADLETSQQKGECSSSSSITTSNHKFCDSDWEII